MSTSNVGNSLLITLALDFGIQFVFYVGSAIAKSEKVYDASGALTYFICILVALFWRQDYDSLANVSFRQYIAAAFVLIWCIRLGVMLFKRVLRTGGDSRFDELKKHPATFAIPWFLQFVWIFLTAFPVYILLANPGITQPAFIASDIIGMVIWVFGFSVEVIADAQKHPNDFVNIGIWRYSRYANYNGEITLWIGIFILCAGGFVENWEFVSIISPFFVAGLIVFVSGVKLQEKSSWKKYGTRTDFRLYVQNTSKYFLWPPKKSMRKQE